MSGAPSRSAGCSTAQARIVRLDRDPGRPRRVDFPGRWRGRIVHANTHARRARRAALCGPSTAVSRPSTARRRDPPASVRRVRQRRRQCRNERIGGPAAQRGRRGLPRPRPPPRARACGAGRPPSTTLPRRSSSTKRASTCPRPLAGLAELYRLSAREVSVLLAIVQVAGFPPSPRRRQPRARHERRDRRRGRIRGRSVRAGSPLPVVPADVGRRPAAPADSDDDPERREEALLSIVRATQGTSTRCVTSSTPSSIARATARRRSSRSAGNGASRSSAASPASMAGPSHCSPRTRTSTAARGRRRRRRRSPPH